MDLETALKGIGSFINKQSRQYESNVRSFLRQKTDQELLSAYRKMDRNKMEFRLLVEEMQRRHLI